MLCETLLNRLMDVSAPKSIKNDLKTIKIGLASCNFKTTLDLIKRISEAVKT